LLKVILRGGPGEIKDREKGEEAKRRKEKLRINFS
jgi:hypothetical protein